MHAFHYVAENVLPDQDLYRPGENISVMLDDCFLFFLHKSAITFSFARQLWNNFISIFFTLYFSSLFLSI